jgi:uncharacterized protein (TIGR02246 family)
MEATMLRSIAFVSLLALGLVIPAVAQQLTEQEAHQVVQSFVDAFDKAAKAKDAAAWGAQYTGDAVRVGVWGDVLVGREAIEKHYADGFPSSDEDPVTLDQVKILSNDVILAIGGWSETWHGPDGPVHFAGRWTNTDVRVGEMWKIGFQTVTMFRKK